MDFVEMWVTGTLMRHVLPSYSRFVTFLYHSVKKKGDTFIFIFRIALLIVVRGIPKVIRTLTPLPTYPDLCNYLISSSM